MPSLHFSSGKVLLQNTVDSLWYYVDIEVFAGNPTLRLGQQAISVTGSYAPYVAMRNSAGAYYKFFLSSIDGNVYYGVAPLTIPEPTVRLYLKSSDNVYREVVLTVGEGGNTSVEIIDPGTNTASLELPWSRISLVAEDTSLRKSIVAVDALGQTEVTIPEP